MFEVNKIYLNLDFFFFRWVREIFWHSKNSWLVMSQSTKLVDLPRDVLVNLRLLLLVYVHVFNGKKKKFVQHSIFAMLDTISVVRCTAVCKLFYEYASDNVGKNQLLAFSCKREKLHFPQCGESYMARDGGLSQR